MKNLLPYPFFVIFSMLAFNATAFSVLLQMDMLIFHALIIKIIAWILTAGLWTLAYVYRNQ